MRISRTMEWVAEQQRPAAGVVTNPDDPVDASRAVPLDSREEPRLRTCLDDMCVLYQVVFAER
jgi:hypothetical protein